MSAAGGTQHRMAMAWGSRRIEYVLDLESRSDLLIAVHPDLRVRVRAPSSRPLDAVVRRIHARRSWIARQLREFERLSPLPPPRFVSGETMIYMGREYRLRVERGTKGVSLQRGRLLVCVPARAGNGVVREAVQAWFQTRANTVFRQRIAKLQRESSILTGLTPTVHVRRMTRRWGSCSARGAITINPALMQAPPSCIDYVLVHELVHLLEPAHSQRFYRLLTRAMPDWRERRERLATSVLRWE